MAADPNHAPGDRTDLQPATASGSSLPAARIHDEIVRQSLDAILITDLDNVVQVWNPAAERLYGIRAADAVGQPLRHLLSSHELDGRPLDSDAARAALHRDGSWRQRLIHRPTTGSRVGEEVMVDAGVSLLRNDDGAALAMLGINRDIGVAHRLEAEIATLALLGASTGNARTSAEVASAALEALTRATGADAGLVTSAEDGYISLAERNVSPSTVEVILSLGRLGGPLATALEAPDAFISADVATAPLREDVRQAVIGDGIAHLVVVGLRVAGRLTGMLALGWQSTQRDEPSKPVVLQAAALVAAAIENARLLQAIERGLHQERRLTRRMRAFVELTRLQESPVESDGEAAIEDLLADVTGVIGAGASVFGRIVDDRLIITASYGIDLERLAPLTDRALSTVPLISRLEDTSALLVPLDSEHVSELTAAVTGALGYRSLAAFAIRDAERIVGVLFSLFHVPVRALDLDERTLDAIGRVLDISFANNRLRHGMNASERRYRELFEGSPDAVVVQSSDGFVVDANPAARRLYGDGLVGHRVDELVAPGEIDTTTDRDGVVHYRATGYRLDGSTFPEEVDVRSIEVGGERRSLAIVRDLTERTRLQTELVQAQKMEAIGLLVAGVAHELNNPLASIVAFSQLIRTDRALPADLHRQAELLVQEANRTRQIVGNLLDFARQRPPERVETRLRPLVESVLALQSYHLQQSQVTVDLDIPDDLPLLSVDRSQFRQVLVNLTVNAAHAIRTLGRPGRISIRASDEAGSDGRLIRIAIRDDGPGVPAEVLDRLFVPFTTTKPPGEGTGLGLSVSFGIVSSHGGTIRHEAGPSGATFVIELPLADVEPSIDEPRRDDAPRPVGPGSAPAAGIPEPAVTTDGHDLATDAIRTVRPLRILVLDDEPSIRDVLDRVLSRNGYTAVIASTGPEALEIVRSDPPDAILCDHRMAGMDGTEVHDAVAAIDPALARRFAFMSGDVLNPELREFARDRGVQLLAKPFDIATVGEMVRRLTAVDPA